MNTKLQNIKNNRERNIEWGSMIISSFLVACLMQYFFDIDGYKTMTMGFLLIILYKLYER